jgi:hypothetical protein
MIMGTQGIPNGVPAMQLTGAVWVKSARSGPTGNCVELAALASSGQVAMRNSRDPSGPALTYDAAEVSAFLSCLKAGDYDHLLLT